MSIHYLKLLAAVVLALPLSSNAACGLMDKRVSFADGSSACLNEFSFLNIKGLMKSIPNESYASKANQQTTFAIAVTAQPMLCPFEQSMQWNWSGADGNQAINSCEKKMNAAVKTLGKSSDVMSCKCEVLIDNGKVKMTRTEFEQKTKLYERQISLGFRAIQVTEGEPKIVSEREAEAVRMAEFKNREDEKLNAIKEREVEVARFKEQQRLAEEARNKEQQRLALESTETSRLRAEFEESKRRSTELENQRLNALAEDAQRKLVELEAQLKLAKQQPQLTSTPVITRSASRKALVIGNDTYKSVAKLINAREDAKAIASSLATVGYQVTLKLDLNEKELKATLRNFSSQVQGGDEVMFFFAGHGVQLGSANYLLPTDIDSESEAQVKDEAIQLQRVLDDMTERKAKFTLAIIDACRDNPFKTNGRAIGGRGLVPTTAATGQMIVFSAGTGQQALDRLGKNDKDKNGVFTRTLLKEMLKPGVSIDRIIKNVREEVADLANTVGHEQVPAIYDQVRGDFYFKK